MRDRSGEESPQTFVPANEIPRYETARGPRMRAAQDDNAKPAATATNARACAINLPVGIGGRISRVALSVLITQTSCSPMHLSRLSRADR